MERNPTKVAEQSLRSAGRRGLHGVGQLWAINQRTATDLMNVTGESISHWMELNKEYLRRVTEQPAPQRVLRLNAEYSRNLLGEVWSDARKRADVMTRASREIAALFTGATTDGGISADPSAGAASAAVAELVTKPSASVGEFQEAAQEAMDDDLQQIDGIGEAMARTLREGGISTIAELAMLDVSSLQDENHPLHSIAGHIVAGEWVEQARALSGVQAT